MTTANTFSHQNDASSRVRTAYCRENLVLLVVLFLEFKASNL